MIIYRPNEAERTMKFRHAAILCALILAGCATHEAVVAPPIPAPSSPSPDAFIAASFACKPNEALKLDLLALRRDPAAYKNKCVHLSGYSNGREMWRDATEVHPARVAPLGNYWEHSEAEERLRRGPSFVEIMGRLRACSEVQKMLAGKAEGLCRNDSGYAIYISAYRIIPTAMD